MSLIQPTVRNPMHRLILTLLLMAGFADSALAAPKIEHWTTDKGLRVYYAYSPGLPILDLRLTFDAGSARDGNKPGLAYVTAALLDKGSGDLDADAIAYRFESVGAQFSASSDLDMASASLRSLTDPSLLDTALDTYIRVVSHPSFPDRDLQRTKNQTLVALKRQNQEPEQIASKAFYAAVFSGHPFASPELGTEQSIPTIKAADVKTFHASHYGVANAVLAMIGDIDRNTAEAYAKRIADALPAGSELEPLPQAAPLAASSLIEKPFPSEQAHVYIGQPGTYRGDPDYFTLYVGNQVLGGGGFSSRLVKEVRIARGLSYSVYSAFIPEVVAGPFMSALQTRADQAKAAADLTAETIKSFVENGPSAPELKDAQDNIIAGFPLRIDSNSELLGYLSLIGYYKLPLDYLDNFTNQISAVTADGVRETFKRRLQPDRMVTVIVGGQSSAGSQPTATPPVPEAASPAAESPAAENAKPATQTTQ